VNAWLIAATALALGFIPCAVVCLRREAMDGLAAVEMAGVLAIWIIVLLAEGSQRAILYDLALALAVLSFPAGMVFANFLERWL
jgi:multisubunit Na+/H+ antiporter MnhF subunit